MAISLVHYALGDGTAWGLLTKNGVQRLAHHYQSTAEILAAVRDSAPQSLLADEEPRAPADLQLMSPITKPCRILCQGANYRQHMIESGLNPDDKQYNLFFTKSDASLAPPVGELRRPPQVALLDYEVELGLVIGQPIHAPRQVSDSDLPQIIGALVIGNDISARDIQLPQMQWFKGKSYRGFCPVGPVLCVLEPDDFKHLDALQLTLKVNGQLRQQDTTANLVYKPAETLSELSEITDLDPGDLVLTGTPSGCALRAPGAVLQKIGALLPEHVKWNVFRKGQAKRAEYLQPGDSIEATICSNDGRIDLGLQRVTVVAG